jgi:hypothetical protein
MKVWLIGTFASAGRPLLEPFVPASGDAGVRVLDGISPWPQDEIAEVTAIFPVAVTGS